MRCHIVAGVLTIALLSTTLPPTALANECGDVAIFGANSAAVVGTNANALTCVVGELEGVPTLLTPGSDLAKVRYTANGVDPLTPTITVLLFGLGHDGTVVIASRTEGTAGPATYDTAYTAIDGVGDLTAVVYSLEGAQLGRVTYSTA